MLDRSGRADNWTLRLLDPVALAVACMMLTGGLIDMSNSSSPVRGLVGVAVSLVVFADLGRRRRPWTYFRSRAK